MRKRGEKNVQLVGDWRDNSMVREDNEWKSVLYIMDNIVHTFPYLVGSTISTSIALKQCRFTEFNI